MDNESNHTFKFDKEALETLNSIDTRLKRLNKLNLHYELIKGLIYGLGFILGSTILLAALVLVLRQFITIPLIGGWVTEIINVVEKKPI